jgi:NADH:ubiquinone oxidoreductase subunit K
LSVDACVTAVALALAISIYKQLNIRDVRDLSDMNEESSEQEESQTVEEN